VGILVHDRNGLLFPHCVLKNRLTGNSARSSRRSGPDGRAPVRARYAAMDQFSEAGIGPDGFPPAIRGVAAAIR